MRPTLRWTQDVMAPASALIIDPVLSDVMFSVAAASSLGFRVTVADSFQEALERLRVPPALLIAHIRLGEYNGLHLVLRGKAAKRDLAAIVTSGVADQVLQTEAEQLGATFVLKPTTTQEFNAAICRTLLQATGGPIRSPNVGQAFDVPRRVSYGASEGLPEAGCLATDPAGRAYVAATPPPRI